MSTLLPHHPPQSTPTSNMSSQTNSASSSPAAPHSTNGAENNINTIEASNVAKTRNNGLTTTLQVERLSEDVEMPEMENPLDAAFDLRAHIETHHDRDIGDTVAIPPQGSALISTGLKVAIPRSMEIQIRPRSGLANDHGITVANSPGTVDPGYRGEIKVILENRDDTAYLVLNGDRIAQAAVRPVVRPSFEEVDEVPEDTERGEGGFGSTGMQ